MFRGCDRIPEWCVHDNDTTGCGGGDIDIIDANARTAHDFQIGGVGQNFFGDFGGGADRQTIVIANDFEQFIFVLAKRGLEINLDTTLFENRQSSGGQSIGNKHTRSHDLYPLIKDR